MYTGPQCTLVRNVRWSETQQNSSRVLIWPANVVELIRKFNRGNKCCVICADPIAQTRNLQQKFSNVRLATLTYK